MDDLKQEIRAALARQQSGLGNASDAPSGLLRRALEEARRPRLVLRLGGAAATIAVAAAVAVAVLLTHGHLRTKPATPMTIQEALTAGPAAAQVARPEQSFVWLIGYVIQPATPAPTSMSSGNATSQGGGQINGIRVSVIDWAGNLRYQFEVPNSRPGRPNEIQTISPDGSRALLSDGTVIDQRGRIIGSIPALAGGGPPRSNSTLWMADDQHVCAAISNEVVADFAPTHPKGAPNATPTPPQPYTLPGADHSVTVKIFGLDGKGRALATVGAGSLGVPSGPFGDSTSMLACNASSDLAVVARIHDADVSGGNSSTNMTASLWAIRLSTGSVLYHQPETRSALGQTYYFGSQNGALAVEFLWNSQVWGTAADAVFRMPSGSQVPVLDVERIPDTPAVSADGTRILRRLVDDAHNQTDLELIDASSGRIVRRVVLPGLLGATAVAMPNSSYFMVQVENYFALVDGNGGVTLLHPDVNVSGLNAPNAVALPPAALQN